jgi:hypothetical protein
MSQRLHVPTFERFNVLFSLHCAPGKNKAFDL